MFFRLFRTRWILFLWTFLGVLGGVIAFFSYQKFMVLTELAESPSFDGSNPRNLFSQRVPASEEFQDEYDELRFHELITGANSELIQASIERISQRLEIPAGLLWCLLFQESRFDHLLGLDEQSAAQGIGQFSTFSFYEINQQINSYSPKSLNALIETLGVDVRPISPNRTQLFHPSSYYNIPTAVVASAIFFNNRYLQLKRAADRRKLRYHPQIVWLFATLSYNKGTRAVLNLWQELYAEEGNKGLEKALTNFGTFIEVVENSALKTKAFSRVWPHPVAVHYANELSTHSEKIFSCALDPLLYLGGGS